MGNFSISLTNIRLTAAAVTEIGDLIQSRMDEWHQAFMLLEISDEYPSDNDSYELRRVRLGEVEASMFMAVSRATIDEVNYSYPDWSIDRAMDEVGKAADGGAGIALQFSASVGGTRSVSLESYGPSHLSVSLDSRSRAWGPPVDIAEIVAILRKYELSPEEIAEASPRLPFRVFVGHGNDTQWRELRDELRDKHGFEIEAFEGKPRVGQTIKDVLLDMAAYSTAAIVILTRADRVDGGGWRGRQNVVHELGLFQGILGWEKVVIVMEEGVEVPTNLDGTQQIRYPEGHIRSAVGEAVAALNALKNLHESHEYHP